MAQQKKVQTWRRKTLSLPVDKTWITSDLHLGHANIIKYCNRPFESKEEMNSSILSELRTKLSWNDVLINLGDNGYGDARFFVDLFSNLPCKEVYLVMGNHDEEIWNEMCEIVEREEIRKVIMLPPIQEIYTSNSSGSGLDHYRIILSHYPLHSWKRSHAKNNPSIHFHGHSHGLKLSTKGRLDVGWDLEHRILPLREAIDICKSEKYTRSLTSRVSYMPEDRIYVMTIKGVTVNPVAELAPFPIPYSYFMQNQNIDIYITNKLYQDTSDSDSEQEDSRYLIEIDLFDPESGRHNGKLHLKHAMLSEEQLEMVMNHPKIKYPDTGPKNY